MSKNFPKHYQSLDRLIESTKQQKGKVTPQNFNDDIEISIEENLETNLNNKIADLFSLAMRPCAAAVIHDDKLSIFANYSQLLISDKSLKKTSKKHLSVAEYCEKILELIGNIKRGNADSIENLKHLFYVKLTAQQSSSFSTFLKEKSEDKEIKTKTSSASIDSYDERDTKDQKFTSLFAIGKEIESIIDKTISDKSTTGDLTFQKSKSIAEFMKAKATLLFDDTTWLNECPEELIFYNYENVQSLFVDFKDKDDIFETPIDPSCLKDQHKKVYQEVHAEILAKVFLRKTNPEAFSDTLDKIGISKPPCFLCGTTFALQKDKESDKIKLGKIITHGEYFAQEGLITLLTQKALNLFPQFNSIKFTYVDSQKLTKENVKLEGWTTPEKVAPEIFYTFESNEATMLPLAGDLAPETHGG